MKILVFSDAHANFEALNSLLGEVKFDFSIFLGDAVDYGPQPGETLDLIMENSDVRIMGNHDRAVAYNEDCHCALEMHDLSEYTRENISKKFLSKEDIGHLKEFRENHVIEVENLKIYSAHASPYNNLYGYLYSTEAEMVWKDKKLREYNYIMVGHTHYMMMYRNKILNPGSSGQPRDGVWMPMYMIFDTDRMEYSFHRFRYDYGKTVSKLEEVVKDAKYLQRLKSFYIPSE
ncbi:metallophosphoesterase family protein [Oxyplasma meridianum]|uniref:Metallophosphoesterase family protein n=1 Tax=Oxyplasma meridianum TaxID=3073602 RepID=A0AAX4NHV5_9ARCH